MSRDKKRKIRRQDDDEQDQPHSFIWHTDKGHKGKLIERILDHTQGDFAKAHQKFLDSKNKSKANNAFKKNKNNNELN